ncbi:unnamed protein product [Candidula unifasciata]|uniref:C-type lectin domain-containing protein n=1 Tax=Candidula unifasciata TaxID=100452 RepID=A0A8S3Z4F6_9EUPU|nr:unnamed protein product [Candidula unifasciata]
MGTSLIMMRVLLFPGLILQSVLAGCNNWDQFGDSCYLFNETSIIWMQAMWSCYESGGWIVQIDSQDEDNFIVGLMKARYVDTVWTGGFATAHWQWMPSFIRIKEYTNWSQGQPDNAEGKEGCLSISKFSHYKWNDEACGNRHPFVCEKSANS